LKELVEESKENEEEACKWSQIAESITGRSGKQCRERWHNHLRPDVKKGEWTVEEDEIIFNMQKSIGNQ
jgi:myb proto-oncogene protein